MYNKLVLGLFLLILVVVLTLQNSEIVFVRFLVWELSMSRALLIFIVFSIGIITGWFLRSYGYRKERKRSREQDVPPDQA